MGINEQDDFISSHKHTNVIVLNVPHRYDLGPISFINYGINLFNK
jgi:hypothetical protein